ncbi:hypothetical protein ACFSHR_05765 [Azotobacter chroococcum]
MWTPLSVVRSLKVLRDIPNKIMALTLPDGRSFSVVFNRADGAALEAVPLERRVAPPDDWPYEVNLRLITVAPPVE